MTGTNERAELHRTIWRAANELRGSVDGWDFKQYMLGFLFYRFISENITEYINAQEYRAGNTNFNYADISDDAVRSAAGMRDEVIKDKGFFIYPSQLFANVRKRAVNDPDLNQTISQIFDSIEGSAKGTDSEKDMSGLFDDVDFNNSRLGQTVADRNDKLVKILDTIGDLPLGNYQDNKIDAFGDAYEYLINMYASNAGKSEGNDLQSPFRRTCGRESGRACRIHKGAKSGFRGFARSGCLHLAHSRSGNEREKHA